MSATKTVCLLCMIGALAACGSSPKERFFTLSDDAVPVSTAPAAFSVAVGPVSVPEGVDRPQFVVRRAANEVMLAEQARWAEPLKSEIARVIASNLAQALAEAYVSSYPQSVGGTADYRVLVDIQRFDSALGDAVTLEALWSVRPARGGESRNGRSLVREPAKGGDYDDLVVAHRRALAAISLDIANAIRAAR